MKGQIPMKSGDVEIIGNFSAMKCNKHSKAVETEVGVFKFESGERSIPYHYCPVCNRRFIGKYTLEAYEAESGKCLDIQQ